MKALKHKLPKPLLAGIVSLTMLTSSASAVDPVLTDTQLHAVLGVVTNFVLDDDGITHNGTSYGTVTSPYTGRVWLDRNLGASQVCTSATDTACYGGYYQWGRNHDGHQASTSSATSTLATNINNVGHENFIISVGAPYDWASVDMFGIERNTQWLSTDGSSVCPVGFRVPLISELKAELLDIDSAEITNNVDAFNTFLKLPSAGFRATSDSFFVVNSFGYLWSSSFTELPSTTSSYINFTNIDTVEALETVRGIAMSVRCIKKITPNEVIHNGTAYGTVTSPYTGKVWLDRNLGASKVCSSSTDTQCYGDYYQWGRNYDGHQEGTSATTTTLATDVNSAGDAFIYADDEGVKFFDWTTIDSSGSIRAANWSERNGFSVCPVGFRVPTSIELQAETLDNGVTNAATAFYNFLKLPTAGGRDSETGNLEAQSLIGGVWTSSHSIHNSSSIVYSAGAASPYYHNRAFGLSVRCLKDDSPVY